MLPAVTPFSTSTFTSQQASYYPTFAYSSDKMDEDTWSSWSDLEDQDAEDFFSLLEDSDDHSFAMVDSGDASGNSVSSLHHANNPSYSNETTHQIVKKRKRLPMTQEARDRRNLRRRAHQFPRLLKTDVRRQYAQMFTNVMNSYDGNLLRKFMSVYCHANVTLLDCAPENIQYKLPPIVQMDGLRSILKYWAYNSLIIPDFICRTMDTEIRVIPSSNESKIICKCIFQGTKVIDLCLGDIDQKIIELLSTSNLSVGDREGGKDVLSRPSMVTLQDTPDVSSLSVSSPRRKTENLRESTTTPSPTLNQLLEMKKVQMMNIRKPMITSYDVPKPAMPAVEMRYEGSICMHVNEQLQIVKIAFLSSKVFQDQAIKSHVSAAI